MSSAEYATVTEIGCSDCDLYQDPIEGCDGPQEVKR